MNITYENVEVSTPFFHENNTAAMNSYEAPVEPEATAEQSSPEENTIFHVIQSIISYASHKKQHDEECLGDGHPGCKTISDNIAKEHQKIEKGKEIMIQVFTPIKLVEDTNPVPWRWENRTAVPVEQRGACLLYRPVTYEHKLREHKLRENASRENASQEAPFCFLHENDVVDNGTVMCLHALGNECFYGNETMKAMRTVLQELEPLYRQEVKLPEFPAPVVWFLLLLFVVNAWKRSATPLP
jgi:hypothetical protein